MTKRDAAAAGRSATITNADGNIVGTPLRSERRVARAERPVLPPLLTAKRCDDRQSCIRVKLPRHRRHTGRARRIKEAFHARSNGTRISLYAEALLNYLHLHTYLASGSREKKPSSTAEELAAPRTLHRF